MRMSFEDELAYIGHTLVFGQAQGPFDRLRGLRRAWLRGYPEATRAINSASAVQPVVARPAA